MSKLDWGLSSAHALYEHGVDRGVVYPHGGTGIAWNGITSIVEDPSDVETTVRFYDGGKYRSKVSAGNYSATVQSLTYPSLLDSYEEISLGLHANSRKGNTYFNFSYRTLTDKGFKLHLVYNAFAEPSDKSYSSLNTSATPLVFGWKINTVPVIVPGGKPSAHFVVDSEIAYPWVIARLESMLYGSETNDPRFPTIDELIDIFEEGSILRITDHGDGTWTADGPDDVVMLLNDTTFLINWPSAVYLDEDTYRVSSL